MGLLLLIATLFLRWKIHFRGKGTASRSHVDPLPKWKENKYCLANQRNANPAGVLHGEFAVYKELLRWLVWISCSQTVHERFGNLVCFGISLWGVKSRNSKFRIRPSILWRYSKYHNWDWGECTMDTSWLSRGINQSGGPYWLKLVCRSYEARFWHGGIVGFLSENWSQLASELSQVLEHNRMYVGILDGPRWSSRYRDVNHEPWDWCQRIFHEMTKSIL